MEEAELAACLEQLHAGVDEAGRGPLAGPVIAAAVVLDPDQPLDGLDDSKNLTEKRRIELEAQIVETALAWAIGRADVAEIDRINILQASLLAMQRAVDALDLAPDCILVDGDHLPRLRVTAHAVIQGDSRVAAISAASILAKQYRDRVMCELDKAYPQYGFARHKGYGTREHLAALRRHGVCPHHRRSFAPVRRLIDGD